MLRISDFLYLDTRFISVAKSTSYLRRNKTKQSPCIFIDSTYKYYKVRIKQSRIHINSMVFERKMHTMHILLDRIAFSITYMTALTVKSMDM